MAKEAVVPNKYGSLFFIKILKPPPNLVWERFFFLVIPATRTRKGEIELATFPLGQACTAINILLVIPARIELATYRLGVDPIR